MSKKPKTASDVHIEKQPKVLADPNQFKHLPISWQLHKIDTEGRWGLQVLRNTSFTLSDDLLSALDNISNELFDSFEKLESKDFNSINHFLEVLHETSGGKLTAQHQKTIVRALAESVFWSEVFPKLAHFETTSWFALERERYGHQGKTKHHFIKIHRIIEEAQQRLAELRLDDVEELFSLRLSGKFRIFAIAKMNTLQVLWFDKNHEICPTSN